MALAAVRSKMAVLLLLVHFYCCPQCLLCFVFGPCLVMQYLMSNQTLEKKSLLMLFWLLFDAVVGWSALCKCGIAWSYSITFY